MDPDHPWSQLCQQPSINLTTRSALSEMDSRLCRVTPDGFMETGDKESENAGEIVGQVQRSNRGIEIDGVGRESY